MAVVMDNPDPIDNFFIEPSTEETNWSESHAMTNNTEVLDTFAACKGRAKLHSSLHDSIRQVWVKLRVPIAFLITTTKYCTPAYNVSMFLGRVDRA